MPEISAAERAALLDELARGTDVPKGTFELGLVLGGTVAAGAYTAGVMDFFFEALDAWQATKKSRDAKVPDWDVVVKAIAGTSGGGVTAALLGRALSWEFPHVRKNTPVEVRSQNPLYRVWVEALDIDEMLDVDDLKRGKSLKFSILNPKPLRKASDLIVNYQSTFKGQARVTNRSYLGERLTLLLTLTNLRGIPYSIDMGGGLRQDYLEHADYVRIAVYTGNPVGIPKPYEFATGPEYGGPGALSWSQYANFALGTAAFPFGFPSQELSRPPVHYDFRGVVIPAGADQAAVAVFKTVDWAKLGLEPEQNYDFLAMDGGVTDNEPIQLARQAISGLLRRNPRQGKNADRAILLVDPFAEPPIPGPTKQSGLAAEGSALISSWKEQARYNACDLLLANAEDCYSRFMITADRKGAEKGGKSIATASVFAFGGFLSKEFRHHDFLLGRENCQRYLREKLVLPIENPLFDRWRQQATAAELARWVVDDNGSPALPIIPLFNACTQDEELVAYPRGAFNPEKGDFESKLKTRLGMVIERLADSADTGGIQGYFTDLYLDIGKYFAKPKLVDNVMDAISHSLKRWGL